MLIKIEIPNEYTNSEGVTLTQEELIQGIAKTRNAHNVRTQSQLTDSGWVAYSVLESCVAWFEQSKNQPNIEPLVEENKPQDQAF